MFGKKSKMSKNDKFVMAAGRKAGNVFGKHSGPAGKSGKASPDPVKPRTLKVGRNSGFKD